MRQTLDKNIYKEELIYTFLFIIFTKYIEVIT